MTHKYQVGDWLYGEQKGDLLKITEQTFLLDVLPIVMTYSVKLYSHVMCNEGLGGIGTGIQLLEENLRPISDRSTTLLCLASDIRSKQYEAEQRVKELKAAFDGVIEARELLG